MLNSNGVEYLVVGGYAVAYHGHPRATGDLDVWLAVSADNANRVRASLRDFGFPAEVVASAPLDVADKIVRMGSPPLRIELLTGVSGVEFGECYRRRETEVTDGIAVPVISLRDLLTNKRQTGRTKDIADLEELD